MTRNNIIISLLAAATTLPAAAQVSKEITVEREVVATLREASPLTFNPAVNLPPVEKPTLSYSERTSTARIPALFSLLEPAALADSVAASPWRGYAAIGYFPAFNLGASAGYRLIDRERTTLDAWLQYDGNRYNATFETADGDDKQGVYDHNAALGLRLAQGIGSKGRLNLGADYALSHFNNPWASLVSGARHEQSVNRFNVNSLFTSRTNDLGYSIGLDYNLFAFAKGYGANNSTSGSECRPVRENRAALNAALFADLNDVSSYRLDIEASLLSRSDRAVIEMPLLSDWHNRLVPSDGATSGLITITPSYRYASSKFSAMIGARVDLSINDGKFFHIAPDVKATWTPSTYFALYGRAGGGEYENTMGSLYAIDRFISPVMWGENSHVPIEAEAGFRVGPFRGASLSISGAYAAANDWLMPFAPAPGMVAFRGVDIRGWQFKARAEYSLRRLATIALTGTMNPRGKNDYDKGYYKNRDMAKYTLDAELTLHPMKQLDIMAGYELRACREMVYVEEVDVMDYMDLMYKMTTWGSRRQHLPNLANLRAGASWRFTPAFTVFLRAENILNRTTPSYSLIPGQGFKGLAGVAYKF